jgi:hypothetical protein
MTLSNTGTSILARGFNQTTSPDFLLRLLTLVRNLKKQKKKNTVVFYSIRIYSPILDAHPDTGQV